MVCTRKFLVYSWLAILMECVLRRIFVSHFIGVPHFHAKEAQFEITLILQPL